MKRTLTYAAASLLVGLGASAPAAAEDWSGFYIGGQAGGQWFDADHETDFLIVDTNGLDGSGFVGGGHIGYLFQSDSGFVFGVEADVELSDYDGDGGADLNPELEVAEFLDIETQLESDWQASVRGRLGYSFGSVLIYGTGGIAFTEFDGSASLSAVEDGERFLIAEGSDSDSRTGWTVGAGLAWLVTNHVSIGAEYRYTDFGTAKFKVDCCEGEIDRKVDLDSHAIRARLTYHFGGTAETQ